MKSLDSLLSITKALLARAGAAVTGLLAFPGVVDVPAPLRAALVVGAAWLTGSAVWLAKNKNTIEKVASDVSVVVGKVDPALAAKVAAELSTVTDKVEATPLAAALFTWAEGADATLAAEPVPDAA